MSNVDVYTGGGGGLERGARRTGRAINRHHACSQIQIAAIDATVDAAIAKVDGASMAFTSSQHAIFQVARVQQQLEQLAPEISGRLSYLADSHLMAVGDFLQDLTRDLRRR